MPSNIIKSFAKQTGNTQKYVEELWEKAKDITEKEYKLKPTSKKYYSIVTGILKKMLKLNEDNHSNKEENLNLLTDNSKFKNVIMKWTGDANEGIGEKSTDNIHPLDKTEPDIGGTTRPASNYERLVLYALAKLVDQQSSTPYLNYPEVAKQVDQFMRTSEADKIIKKCTNRSPEYCAEILFDIFPKFQNESNNKENIDINLNLDKLWEDINKLKLPEKHSHKKYIGNVNNVDIFLVDGDEVKKEHFMDFVEGGHDIVYRFIPENQVWIDYNISNRPIYHIIYHELIERTLMLYNKMNYEQAHNIANKEEQKRINVDIKNESINKKELKLGIQVEKEHKDVYDMFKKILDKKNIKMPLTLNQFAEIIAKSHLEEMENYYTELRKMESQLKK